MDKRIRKEIPSKNKQKGFKKIFVQIIIAVIITTACSIQKKQSTQKIIAQYKDNKLLWNEVAPLLKGATSKEDSLLILKHYTNNWINTQILAEKAKKTLEDTVIDSIDNYILFLRKEILSNTFMEQIIKEKLDTNLSEYDYKKTYELVKYKFPAQTEYFKYVYLITPNWRLSQKVKNILLNEEWDNLNKIIKNKYVWEYSPDSVWRPKKELIELFKKGKASPPAKFNTEIPYVNWIVWNNKRAIIVLKIIKKTEIGEPTPLPIIKNKIKLLALHRKRVEFIEKIINKLKNEEKNKIFIANLDSVIR